MELKQVVPLKHASVQGLFGFSLIFLAEGQDVWRQGTYAVEAPDASSMQIFLVPVGVDQGGVIYEAVFN